MEVEGKLQQEDASKVTEQDNIGPSSPMLRHVSCNCEAHDIPSSSGDGEEKRQSPSKRPRDIEVINVDSDSAESEAAELEIAMDSEEEEEESEHQLRTSRPPYRSPGTRKFRVDSSEEEDDVSTQNRTAETTEEEDNASTQNRAAEMVVASRRGKRMKNLIPSAECFQKKAALETLKKAKKHDIEEPTGRRRLFEAAASPLSAKQLNAAMGTPQTRTTETKPTERRRTLKGGTSPSSSSSQEISAIIENDSDELSKPIGRRRLFNKAGELSFSSSQQASTLMGAREADYKELSQPAERRKLSKAEASSSPQKQKTEAARPTSSPFSECAPSMCREIGEVGRDQSAAIEAQTVSANSEVRNSEAAKKVKEILRLFNSYYLRFVQEEEARCRREATEKDSKSKKKARNEENDERKKSRRPDLKAITQMKIDKKMADRGKIIGPLPGINVGDQFFSRCEMIAIGLHCHWLGGIDTIPASSKKALNIARLPVASSIILSGAYEDDIDNSEDVIYTGQGGNDLLGNKRQIADQVLKRGNLALKNNMEQDIPVRLVRGHKTKKSYTGKVYTYDGLYKVKDFWAEKGISGFTVYKFRLKRVEAQPILTTNQVHFVSGQAVPTNISELKGLVCADISNGLESTPIPASNVHNPPLAPNGFRYTATIEVRKGVRTPPPAKGCSCKGECVDPYKCSCAILNKKRFPYVLKNGGRLVEPMDVVYECGPQCGCDNSCSNRVTQKGMQYRLEVFRTANKGWGVRSWDTIPAGAPVCQYSGVLMRTEDADSICENEYIFELDCLQTMKSIGVRQRRLISTGEAVEVDDEDAFKDVPEQPEYCIDAGSCGNVSRLINHSCEPNLFVQCVLNDHHDLSQPRIWFFAADTIHPLQELSYDYGYELDSVVKNGKVKVLPCYCGAHGCRKRLH